MRTAKAIVSVLTVFALFAQPAFAGKITGSVRDRSTGRPIGSVQIRAYASGRSMGVACSSDNDGRYVLDNLDAGNYAVCINTTDRSRPQVTSTTVRQDGEAKVDFRIAPSTEVNGDSWLQGYPVFYQSFVATGLGITSLRLKAFGPGRAVTVQLLEGDGISGRPVGPSRTTPAFGGEGEASVYWTGGEAPTIPGKVYTFKMSAEKGKTWIPGVAGRGDVYQLGQAYFGNDARPLSDLGFSVCEENDNLSTNYAVAAGRRAILVKAVGQTFVARSKDIRFAAASIDYAIPKSVYVRFSIHENGPGGKQIGPSKGTTPGSSAFVAWLPGEVRVAPGKKYYLHIESYDGTQFYAFEELDPYTKGGAYNDAALDRRYDMAAWITGELNPADQVKLFKHPKAISSIALVNPSFEEGMKGWTLTKECGGECACEGGVIPAWGAGMFGWTKLKEGENSRTILYQNISVTKGKHYAFSGSLYTDHIGGRSSDQKIRLVMDPSGSGKFDSSVMESSQWYATEGEWRRGSVEFVAKSNKISLGFELEQRWSQDLCSLYVDGAYLEEIAY